VLQIVLFDYPKSYRFVVVCREFSFKPSDLEFLATSPQTVTNQKCMDELQSKVDGQATNALVDPISTKPNFKQKIANPVNSRRVWHQRSLSLSESIIR